jgi:hypothetical protein
MMISQSIIHRVLINISSFLMTYFSSSRRAQASLAADGIKLLHPRLVYSRALSPPLSN